MKRVGVLALQGDVREHCAALDDLGVEVCRILTARELDDCQALILPGGESTTISLLLDKSELFEPVQKRIDEGMPVFGTCAGMILLARNVADGRPDQKSFGAIDISVTRNAYGSQSASFEASVTLPGGLPFPAVFIRAPRVDEVGPGVEILAEYDGKPVLCRQGSVLVSSFHPELSSDRRVHELFLEGV